MKAMSDQSLGEIKILIFFACLVICAGGLLYFLTCDVATEQHQNDDSAEQCIDAALSKIGTRALSRDRMSARVEGNVQPLDRRGNSYACVVTIIDRDDGNVKRCEVVTFPKGEMITNCSSN